MNQEAGTKEVLVKQAQAVTTANLADWGEKEVSANDLIVPQILVMQGLSQFVTDGDALIGEFRNSLTKELMGKYDSSPVEVIPFHCQEVFSIQAQESDGSFKYHSTEPIVKSPMKAGYNDNAPWDDKMLIDGVMTPIKRIRRYNFFVLLPKELEELGAGAQPYFISFKSTGVKEGKKLFNMMYVRNRGAGLAPAAFQFKISGRKEKNDKGTFIIPTVEQSVKTDPLYLQQALYWFKKLNGGTVVKLHEEDAAPEASTTDTGAF